MLILSRLLKERIYCQEIDGWISVEKISGNTVRIGLDFPESIELSRGEKRPPLARFLTSNKNSQKKEVRVLPIDESQPPESNDGMLVLSRKVKETILISDNVTLVIVEIRGNKVRLGLEGPNWLTFIREELMRKEAESALA